MPISEPRSILGTATLSVLISFVVCALIVFLEVLFFALSDTQATESGRFIFVDPYYDPTDGTYLPLPALLIPSTVGLLWNGLLSHALELVLPHLILIFISVTAGIVISVELETRVSKLNAILIGGVAAGLTIAAIAPAPFVSPGTLTWGLISNPALFCVSNWVGRYFRT